MVSEPAEPRPGEEPPASAAGREHVLDHTSETRDTTPATGRAGGPASWERAEEGAPVALAKPAFEDGRWSYLYGADTQYAQTEPVPGQVAEANRRGRSQEAALVQGPVIKAPVWTWEVPLYFWFGGIAAGSSFVGLACDLAGDHRSAAIARKMAVAAVLPSPPLLIMDLGRPARFLNMLRIFKPRSPMNLGAWCLAAFSTVGATAVAADLAGRPRAARALGGANAVLGGYLGSYTGVLLAATAVPVWSRSRLLLGPVFVCTATAGGAAATRLALVARGLPEGHPTRQALGTVETGAMLAELVLSAANERRLGRLKHALEEGRPGRLFHAAEAGVVAGLALRFARGRLGPKAHHLASLLYLASGLAFRYAWVEAGPASARDDEAVAATARGKATWDDRLGRTHTPRLRSQLRRPAAPSALGAAWTGAVGRLSLLAERRMPWLRHH